MEKEKEKTIDVLNSLITINNDRIEGYKTASEATEEQELKTLFGKLSTTSQKCKKELDAEVTKCGGTPTDGTQTKGKFFRAWMDVKAALTGKDRKAILNSCEQGEDAAVNTYKKVLKNDSQDFNPAQKSMVTNQHVMLKADHDDVKALCDALEAVN